MRIERVTFAGIGLTLLFAAGVASAQVDYADAGAFAFSTSDLDAGTAGSVGGSLVVPNEPGPFPLIVASHGWSGSSVNQLGWAQHFASYGFVVAVPSFPNPLSPDETVDQAVIVALVALYADPATVSPAQGKVDPTRIGLEGHSAGGLASTLAAQALGPGALVLFDPVDAADAGEAAYATLCAPSLDVFADPSSCNNEEEWSSFASDTNAPRVFFHVIGSTHCDGENQDQGAACGLVCGGDADPVRQAVYARYATAFFLAHLKGDPAAAAMFAPAALAADTSIADAGVQAAGQGCAADGGGSGSIVPSDGGAGLGSEDGGSSVTPIPPGGSGGGPDSGSVTATGNGAASGGATPGASSGCGCAVAGARPPGSAAALLVATIALAWRGSRRTRRSRSSSSDPR